MDASEIYSKRLNAKELIFPKEKGEFIFPIADGRIKTLGGELRTSTLVRHRPIQGESHVDFLGESEGSPFYHLTTRFRMPVKRYDFWKQMGYLCSIVAIRSGQKKWWADSMVCCCHLRNIQGLLSDGKAPFERRFGMPFDGRVIPCAAMVEYHPISAKDLSR